MSLKPMIREGVALNAHPLGCKQNIINQINELKDYEVIQEKPINVLIIGGSSGYGLASRIALTFKGNAYTYNVSYERAARGRGTASAGYYNNHFFEEIAQQHGFESDDLNADCFAHETKQRVIDDLKSKNKKIDCVIYSVASGIRIDPDTQKKYVSSLKPINQPYTGTTIDIMSKELKTQTLQPATAQEIEDTINVMGGSDYYLWAKALVDADLINEGCKFVTYTYIGSSLTDPIYKDGTIGQAKRDLEKTNKKINALLKPYDGEAIISASKAVVTKASVFIPTMAIYVSALFKVMKEEKTHETITQHKYRLFKDRVYGQQNTHDIYRLDKYELQAQSQVEKILAKFQDDEFLDMIEFKYFKQDFLNMNGFDVDNCDYSLDVSEYIKI
ncbi:enoyl-ACP reductase FabV [Erysipelothrix urinaevulpis]|uniref:enoyl-ACP reductase FabV n=1 Tax=Erysipelothrix urinaevulpis TaxID=2683717 RepID=UPI0013578FC4|nr:enoyl-ACP reductase FabV [Erysipelothrix urinaevulpis]